MTTTTLRAPVELSRRRLTGLLAVVTAATAAVTWTVTTIVGDDAAEPVQATTADAMVSARAAPIVVADAYHGVGLFVCSNGEPPVAVADAYHGTGITVCL
jgi:hypothetical protein